MTMAINRAGRFDLSGPDAIISLCSVTIQKHNPIVLNEKVCCRFILTLNLEKIEGSSSVLAQSERAGDGWHQGNYRQDC